MSKTSNVIINESGRILIPVAVRKELGFEADTSLILTVEGDRLIIESPLRAWKKLQDQFAGTSESSIVDELIADRRREAREEW